MRHCAQMTVEIALNAILFTVRCSLSRDLRVCLKMHHSPSLCVVFYPKIVYWYLICFVDRTF